MDEWPIFPIEENTKIYYNIKLTLVAGSMSMTPFLLRPISNTSGNLGSVVCYIKLDIMI